MNIDKYKQPDGTYEIDGVYFEDAVSVYQGYVLNFCCCGSPQDNLEYIRRGLQLIKHRCRIWEKQLTWEDYEELRREHHGSDAAALFFDYWADSLKLTEHGSGIGGAWLTDKGKEVLFDLNEMYSRGLIPQT